MAVEAATYVADLNASNPAGGDAPPSLGTHIRLLKAVLKASFPNVAGAVTPTHTELNYCDGVTGNIQTQIDGKFTYTSGSDTTPDAARFQVQIVGASCQLPSSPQAGDVVIFVSSQNFTVSIPTGHTFRRTAFTQVFGSANQPFVLIATSSTNWEGDWLV